MARNVHADPVVLHIRKYSIIHKDFWRGLNIDGLKIDFFRPKILTRQALPDLLLGVFQGLNTSDASENGCMTKFGLHLDDAIHNRILVSL